MLFRTILNLILHTIGSDYVINRKKKEIALEIEKITQGAGVDAVVDNAGQKTLMTSISSVRRGGKLQYACDIGK